jgi:hypothetical protein
MGKGLPRSYARSKKTSVQGQVVRQTIVVKNGAVTVVNGSSAPGIGTLVIGDLPAGQLRLLGARAQGLVFSTSDADAIATWDGDWALGSAPNADADLADAADIDLLPSTAIGAATAKVSPTQDAVSTATQHAGAMIDNKDGSKELNLNIMVDDASQSGDISMVVNGVFELAYLVF